MPQVAQQDAALLRFRPEDFPKLEWRSANKIATLEEWLKMCGILAASISVRSGDLWGNGVVTAWQTYEVYLQSGPLQRAIVDVPILSDSGGREYEQKFRMAILLAMPEMLKKNVLRQN